MRDGVTFSDGDKMDANDVYFTLQSRLEFGTASTIGNPFKVELVDDMTVKVYWDSFSLNCETWILPQYIFSKDTFEAHGGKDNGGIDWMCNNMLGTGPYIMKQYIRTLETYAEYQIEIISFAHIQKIFPPVTLPPVPRSLFALAEIGKTSYNKHTKPNHTGKGADHHGLSGRIPALAGNV